MTRPQAQVILADYIAYRRGVGPYDDGHYNGPAYTPAEIGQALDVAYATLAAHEPLRQAARTVLATRRGGTRSQSLVLSKALDQLTKQVA
jgi:hypothetical protein